MSSYHLLLSLLTFIAPTLTTTITFSTSPSSTPSISQLCTSSSHPDICCLPLTLNLLDGRGYTHPPITQVSFSRIESPSTVSVVYAFTNAHEPPCSSEVVAVQHGNLAWQTEVLRRGGAGSASAVTTFRPIFLKRRIPDVVVVGEVEYENIGAGSGGVVSFVSSSTGRIILGRELG
ncbi:MAG: hypothetical protein Q9166_006329 [cf. Caloplaca sp. 2 TL-2023]